MSRDGPPLQPLSHCRASVKSPSNVRTNYAAPASFPRQATASGIFHGAARIWCRGRRLGRRCGRHRRAGAGRGALRQRHCRAIALQDMILPEPAFMVEPVRIAPSRFGTARPHHRGSAARRAPLRSPRAKGRRRRLGAAIRASVRHAMAAALAAGARPGGRLMRLRSAIGRTVAAASRALGVSRSHFSRTLSALTGPVAARFAPPAARRPGADR